MLNTKVGQVLAVGAVAAVGVWYIKGQAKQAAAAVGDAVNPVSQDNLAYKGANALGEVITGQDGFNLGHWLYDKFNG